MALLLYRSVLDMAPAPEGTCQCVAGCRPPEPWPHGRNWFCNAPAAYCWHDQFQPGGAVALCAPCCAGWRALPGAPPPGRLHTYGTP